MAGRPREFDREQALLKARDLFWRQGYEGTSLSDLVAELGIASARIYKAFGSKELLFREAVASYESHEGGFADRAFSEESSVRAAIKRLLNDAVMLYSRADLPQGCMVVSSAASVSDENSGIKDWLAEHRLQRTQGIIDQLRAAIATGELPPQTDADALGDYFAAFLHGLSVQARDGVSRPRLEAAVKIALLALESGG
ncbi:TetR/AcrR family transcriptional regulator [Serratia proteamaculans]|jgi:AcrR family transcriptional regulator|uniref:TetR/AcrR family transcriptional regulator n=1 Tax=Serratia proteamaculans TaxID=28151 RepID=UPI0021784E15|nr:TetR/AcrR family transcriptional regulator [Serratia proteamaculans]CAI0902661.1 Bacterial regulatory proteins, tetR family [Serratia proteamaculans]CAI1549621.1 Bacterial regulatory proteins, tetR family [Serratia proteamaculans]CAI1605497.1 Bacterial regulatory proteins, tetR family [Serratia proteamaculans]CAI1776575.1 Bacterial regulatory proteins, tetR family [Serratia proteamaculans]CAI1879165.1 Bacterial regulatory proteins, tetR family [Serratia proteamaculans]